MSTVIENLSDSDTEARSSDESPSKSRRKSNSPRSANISKAAAQQSRSRSSSTAKRSGEESLWKSSPSLSTAELHPPQRGHKADLAGNEKRRKSHKGRDRSRSVHQQKDLPTIDSSHALPSALVEDEKLSLRPLVARHDDWLVEEPSETYSRATITEYKHSYAKDFLDEPHANFFFMLASEQSEHQRDGIAKSILSVKIVPEQTLVSSYLNMGHSHRFLLQDETGFEEGVLSHVPATTESDFVAKVKRLLRSMMASKELSVMATGERDDEVKAEIAKLEEKHSRTLKTMKIAVLYAKPGQKDIEGIWKNAPPANSQFYKFLDAIADRVVVDEAWKKYRGEMGVLGADLTTKVYYKKWNDVEVIFHVAPLMDEEQHRRLCGNDLGVLIYYDSYDPSEKAPAPDSKEEIKFETRLIVDIAAKIMSSSPERILQLSRFFFKTLSEKAPEMGASITMSMGEAEEKYVSLLTKIVDFVSKSADEDPSISQENFDQRRNFYNFMGLDEKDFDVFCRWLVVAIKNWVGADFTTAHEAAWTSHLKTLSMIFLGEAEYKPKRKLRFTPFGGTAMGSVPQVFAVVEPHPYGEQRFRLGFFQRPTIGAYQPPAPPANHFFSLTSVGDWLFAKFYNGFFRAAQVPPFDKLFLVPRREAIKALGVRFTKRMRWKSIGTVSKVDVHASMTSDEAESMSGTEGAESGVDSARADSSLRLSKGRPQKMVQLESSSEETLAEEKRSKWKEKGEHLSQSLHNLSSNLSSKIRSHSTSNTSKSGATSPKSEDPNFTISSSPRGGSHHQDANSVNWTEREIVVDTSQKFAEEEEDFANFLSRPVQASKKPASTAPKS